MFKLYSNCQKQKCCDPVNIKHWAEVGKTLYLALAKRIKPTLASCNLHQTSTSFQRWHSATNQHMI